MRIVDCFSGLGGDPEVADLHEGGWGNTARAMGHEVFTIDYEARFRADLVADIRDVKPSDLPWRPDLFLASPPCEGFSVARIGVNWYHDHTPKTDVARRGLEILEAFMRLLEAVDPEYFVIENPDGKMKRMKVLENLERRDITYCRLGLPYKKRTNVWGRFPQSLELPPPCDTNGRPQRLVTMSGKPFVPQSKNDDGSWLPADERPIWTVDKTTGLPCHHLEVLRWAWGTQPEWIACEQVPQVLPLWQAIAHTLEAWGYSAWAGLLNAADYGVPQTRQRAILMASTRKSVAPPPPTHSANPAPSLFPVERWVTMAEALGWPCLEDPPAWGSLTRVQKRRHAADGTWPQLRPATTIMGDPRVFAPGRHEEPGEQSHHALTVTVQQAAVLQSFRADYPFQGSSTSQRQQVGNAVPPLLGAKILEALVR